MKNSKKDLVSLNPHAIQRARKAAGLTLSQATDGTGKTRAWLHMIERGKIKQTTKEAAQELANKLRVTLKYITEGGIESAFGLSPEEVRPS
jgi:transcriptional regulator with XRE-family HTH domain